MALPFGSGTPYGAASSAGSTSPAMSEAEVRLHTTEPTTPMTETEGMEREQMIAYLNRRLRQMQAEIQELRDTVRRQQATIRTQSEAIAHPKQHYETPPKMVDNPFYGGPPPFPPTGPVAPAAPLASFNAGPSTGLSQANPLPMMPSAFDEPRQGHVNPTLPGTPFSHPWSQGPGPAQRLLGNPPSGPMPVRTSSNKPPHNAVNTFGSPEPLRPYGSTIFNSTPQSSARGMRVAPPSGSQNLRGPLANRPPPPLFHGTPVLASSSGDFATTDTIRDPFYKFWDMAFKYAHNHVNFPSTARDQNLPQEIKDRLMHAASRTTAFQLMSTPYTRYMLVAKIIIQWITKNVLKHDSFAGFNQNVDQIIQASRNQIYHSTPAQVKYQLLTSIGDHMKGLKTHPGFDRFVNDRTKHRANELWAVIKPMMHQKTTRDWDDLLGLMTHAHKLALVMYSGAAEYRFETPAIGVRFQRDTMEPREPYPNIRNPEELERDKVTIRLGMTPHITVRTSTEGGLVHSRAVLPAWVLLKTDK